jgi:hypothetical protein
MVRSQHLLIASLLVLLTPQGAASRERSEPLAHAASSNRMHRIRTRRGEATGVTASASRRRAPSRSRRARAPK